MPQPAKTQSGQRRWVKALGRTLSGILVLATLFLGWFVYRVYYADPRTDDAYVHANTAALAFHSATARPSHLARFRPGRPG